jgi:hypothetical protein
MIDLKPGDRVRTTDKYLDSLRRRAKPKTGVVHSVPRSNIPRVKVLWDGRSSPVRFHVSFLEREQ